MVSFTHQLGWKLSYQESNSDKLTIIVAGSGPTDRDGNNPLYQNNSLKMLAEALYEQDISSFRYDKRWS